VSQLVESLISQPESSQVHRCNGSIYDRNEDGDLDITDHTRLVSSLYHRKQETYSENKIFPYATLDHLRENLIAKARHAYGNQDTKLEEGDIFRISIKLPKSDNQPAPNSIPESETGAESATQSTDPVIRLLKQLKDGEKSSSELRLSLKLKHRQTFRKNYLHPAMERGLIEYTISEKPNSRLQKYRLTGKGRVFLEHKQKSERK